MSGMKISRRAQRVAPFYAMEFAKKAGALDAAGHDVIRLNIGEPDFGAPPAFLAAARELTDGRPLAYTDARWALRHYAKPSRASTRRTSAPRSIRVRSPSPPVPPPRCC